MCGKEKTCGRTILLESYIQHSISVYCRSNVKSRTGTSIFLCYFSENECSEQSSESYRNGRIVRRQKSFIDKHFRHMTKNLSHFTDKVFTDKVFDAASSSLKLNPA